VAHVTTADGRPAPDAVVALRPTGAASKTPIRFPWPLTMAQQNIAFDPFVLIVPLGGEVTFPNRDKVRHHVYSFSPAKKFELKLYGREETRTMRFDKAGVVAVGCNIHDQMAAFIFVTDTPYTAKTNAAGDAVLHDVPAGKGQLSVWQPYMKAPGNQVTRPVTVSAQGGRENLVIELRAIGPGHTH